MYFNKKAVLYFAEGDRTPKKACVAYLYLLSKWEVADGKMNGSGMNP